jgi:hypothetical protein
MKADWMSKPVKVYGWAMTVNGWEYYFLDNKKSDVRFAYICGFENEMGDVSMSEILPYIRSITFKPSDLADLAPVPGCEWVD